MAGEIKLGAARADLVLGNSQFKKALAGSVISLTALGAAALAVGVKATKMAAKFELGMKEISTLLNTTAKKTLPGFEKGIKEMSVAFGEPLETLQRGLYDIVSAGIDAGDALAVLEVASKAAKGGLTNVAVTADALTTIINSYKLEAKDAADVSDLLFTVVKRGKTTMDQLAPSVGMVASLSATAGLSLDEMGAALATMTRAGLKTDIAVTSLKSIMTAFLKPTAEAVDVAAQLGFELNSTTLKTIGLEGVTKLLKKGTQEQTAAIFSNVRALTGMSAILQNTTGFQRDLAEMSTRSGAATDAFNEIMSTTDAELKRVSAAFNVLWVEVGKDLLPAVIKHAKDFVLVLGQLARDYNAFMEDRRSLMGLAPRDASDQEKKIARIKEEIRLLKEQTEGAEIWGSTNEKATEKLRAKWKELREAEDEYFASNKENGEAEVDNTDNNVTEIVDLHRQKLFDMEEMDLTANSLSLENYTELLTGKYDLDTAYSDWKDAKRADEENKNGAFSNKMLKNYHSLISQMTKTASSFSTYKNMLFGQEQKEALNTAESEYNARRKYIIDNVADEEERTRQLEALETEYSDAKQKINETYDEKQRDMHKKMKPLLIAEAAANTAVAVTKALAGAPVLRWIEAGLIAAQGALQIATIKKQEFSEGGSFVVPPGFQNDSYPIWVESGEGVNITSARNMKSGENGGSGSVVFQIENFAPISFESLSMDTAEESAEVFINGINERLPKVLEMVKLTGVTINDLEGES